MVSDSIIILSVVVLLLLIACYLLSNFKRKKLTIANITKVNPYYVNPYGETGFAQCIGVISTHFVAIPGKNGRRIIVEVTSKKTLIDFGGKCTNFNFKATGHVLE